MTTEVSTLRRLFEALREAEIVPDASGHIVHVDIHVDHAITPTIRLEWRPDGTIVQVRAREEAP